MFNLNQWKTIQNLADTPPNDLVRLAAAYALIVVVFSVSLTAGAAAGTLLVVTGETLFQQALGVCVGIVAAMATEQVLDDRLDGPYRRLTQPNQDEKQPTIQ